MTQSAERLLTCKDVAERLRVSESWAQKLMASGAIGVTRVGRMVRVTESSLADYIAANTAPPRRSRRGTAA